jgi:hypothetical protein
MGIILRSKNIRSESFTRKRQYVVSATDKMNGYMHTKQVFLDTITTFGLLVREVNRIVSFRWYRSLFVCDVHRYIPI